MTGLNPLAWYGGAFLALYATLFVGALIAGGAIAHWLRPEGRSLPAHNEDELAMLAGGAKRLTETVLARLLARGHATIERSGVVLRQPSPSASAIERDVASLPSPAKWRTIQREVASAATRLEDQLVARELLIERAGARQLGFYAAIPLLLLLGLGFAKYQVGTALGRPVGFLTLFMIATAIAALIRVLATNRRTKGGNAALREAKQRSERLRRAPTNDEMGTAVALYGTAVLVGSPLADLHQMRRGDSSGGGGDGGSSSSGCGGGGCGGCGGS